MEYNGSLSAFGIKCYNAPGLGENLSNLLHISSAVVIPPTTRSVVTSGQTGYNQDMVYPDDLQEQYLNAFQNVEDALLAAGVTGGWKAVYQMTTYHAGGLTTEVDEALDVAVKRYFGHNRPAWTGIGVEGLYGGAKVEICVWAALPT